MNELHLFAGAGGGIIGGELLGHTTVCAVEIEEYPRKVLLQRQRDGILPRFPIWDDIRTFDGRPWKGRVDIVSGGFPCQDISAAGKGAGIEGERSGLWGEMARVIGEVRPRFPFVENSPMLTSRGLGTVLGDLAEMGYNARWCVLGADDAGAPHRRKRIWILGYLADAGRKHGSEGNTTGLATSEEVRTDSTVHNQSSDKGQTDMADTNGQRLQRADVREAEFRAKERLPSERRQIAWWDIDPADLPYAMFKGLQECDSERVGQQRKNQKPESLYGKTRGRVGEGTRAEWPTESPVGRVAHGVAHRVDRLKAIGNGQVSAVAALAFTILSEGLV